MITKDLKRKWTEALRSGNYQQGKGRLRLANDQYCPLGVLCDIYNPTLWGNRDLAFGFYSYDEKLKKIASLPDFIPLDEDMQRQIWLANDVTGKSFSEIADWIDLNVEAQ